MILEINNVQFAYEKNQRILNDISFTIDQGEQVALIGSNGAGKSTLLKMIVGLLEPDSGIITAVGHQVNKKSLAEVRKKIGFVFQEAEYQLFMPTVYEDIAFGLENYGMKQEEVEMTVQEILSILNIEDLSDKRTTRLSGGEKKLVSIGTVLALQPELLIFDEPTIALDPLNRRGLIKVLNELKMAKLIATHDLDMVLDTCDKVIILSKGNIVVQGKPKDILLNQAIMEECGLELPLSMQSREEL